MTGSSISVSSRSISTKTARCESSPITGCRTARYSTSSAAPRRRLARRSTTWHRCSRHSTSAKVSKTIARLTRREAQTRDDPVHRFAEKTPRLAPRGFCLILYRRLERLVCQNRQQQQRHDVGDLDHRVDGGTCRVLVGIADSIAGDRGLVGG